MGDIFIEQIVKKHTGAGQKGIFSLLSVLAAVIFCAGFFFNMYICIIGILVAVGAYFYKKNMDVEYEYCLINGQLDIDKVIANSSRKELISVDIKDIEVMAPFGSSNLDRFSTMKKLDFSSGIDSDRIFVMVVRTDKETVAIQFNPNNKMMDAIYSMARGKVFAV